MKKKDLENSIICFASYLDYCKTAIDKNQKQPPSFEDIHKNFYNLFEKVIQDNRVAYVNYRLSFVAEAAAGELNQKEQNQ